jgi:CubicO group peptidase (beta-lactamase class C family)
VDNLRNWAHMCAVLVNEKPWWEPGTRFGYHAQTFGFLPGEIMRRATGRTISTLLRDVVTGPLGIEDDVTSESRSRFWRALRDKSRRTGQRTSRPLATLRNHKRLYCFRSCRISS